MPYRYMLLCLIIMIAALPCTGQELLHNDSLVQVPEKFGASIDKKIGSLDKKLTRQSEKYLRDFAKQEEKIFSALAKTDSGTAAALLQSGRETYQKLSNTLSDAGSKTERILSGEYIPLLDSLQGSLGFLQQAQHILSPSENLQQRLGGSLEQVNRFQHRLAGAADIQNTIAGRQQQLQELLSGYTNLPKEVSKYFGKYKQQAFYYGQQVREYRDILNEPDKLIAKTLSILQHTGAFQQYMQKYSMLAALFPTPENYGTPQALAGLQTRAAVQQQLLQRLPSGVANGGNPAQYLQEQMQQAQGELNKLKEQLDKLGISEGGSGDMVMPENFRPDATKTKPLRKKIEYSANFQTQRSTQFYPVRTDVALLLGYRASDKAVIGVGLSGRVGWGDSWQKIRLTTHGFGMRSYFDWKAPDLLKTKSRFMGGLWFTAGAELNYNRTIESLAVFKNYSNWHKSALVGLTKKFSMSSPLKKGRQVQGNIQLLYDALHKRSVPPAPALVWRVGYGL